MDEFSPPLFCFNFLIYASLFLSIQLFVRPASKTGTGGKAKELLRSVPGIILLLLIPVLVAVQFSGAVRA